MNKELTILEQKVELLILSNARLRADNHHLRQQLAQFLNGHPIEELDPSIIRTPQTPSESTP